jgi:CRISPR/Cas system-associated exonuclease Cas4 (RecB family)
MAAQSGGLMEFEDEIKISPELQPLAEKWYITSSADGRFTIRDVPGGPPVLRIGLEIKTEAPDGYSKLTAPKEEHIDQAHIYMACLDVPVFWFLYINKGNQNNTGSDGPFFITFDHDRWARIEQKMAECHDAAEKNELPPREESMVCQFCPYAYTCQPPSQGRSNRKLVPLWRP